MSNFVNAPMNEFIDELALTKASKDVADILSIAMVYTSDRSAIVVFDQHCDLALALTEAYRRSLPAARFVNFDEFTPQQIVALFEELTANDLVVLIQSTHFRLNAYRIRVELFKRSLKVVEHPHLGRMQGQEMTYYLDGLAYDPSYFRGVGHALKQRIDSAHSALVDSDGALLRYSAGFESAKLNIGDYSAMPNVGGQFPIGEVFTESKHLQAVNGEVRIFVFGDTTFTVNKPAQPITLVIREGRVVDVLDSTPEFDVVMTNIRNDDGGEVWVRELGFGLNRAFSHERTVSDIGTFERMCGVHLSLGSKHGIYAKPNFKRNDGKHHVDVFAVTKCVHLDDEMIFSQGAWTV